MNPVESWMNCWINNLYEIMRKEEEREEFYGKTRKAN